jgi:hypothetical protein
MARAGNRVAATTLNTAVVTMDEFRRLMRIDVSEPPPDPPEGGETGDTEQQSAAASQ